MRTDKPWVDHWWTGHFISTNSETKFLRRGYTERVYHLLIFLKEKEKLLRSMLWKHILWASKEIKESRVRHGTRADNLFHINSAFSLSLFHLIFFDNWKVIPTNTTTAYLLAPEMRLPRTWDAHHTFYRHNAETLETLLNPSEHVLWVKSHIFGTLKGWKPYKTNTCLLLSHLGWNIFSSVDRPTFSCYWTQEQTKEVIGPRRP